VAFLFEVLRARSAVKVNEIYTKLQESKASENAKNYQLFQVQIVAMTEMHLQLAMYDAFVK